MSLLKALKLANAVLVRARVDPVQRARKKIIAALAEQKRHVVAGGSPHIGDRKEDLNVISIDDLELVDAVSSQSNS